MNSHHLTSRQALSLTAGLLILTPCAGAAPFRTFDNGGGDADFGNALNWDSNTVPGQDEGAVINVFSPNVELLITSNQTVDTLRINDGRTVTQSAGTLTIANAGNQFERGLWIGEFGGGNVYNMNGGSIIILDDFDGLILGKAGGSEGTMNFTGGTITNTAGDTFIGADQKGTWNQTGGTFTAGTVYLARWGSPNFEQGTVNLDGGIFAATRVQKGDGDEAIFNFNGGTLQARASVGDFFHSMTRANVRNGGAIIDTNGFDVTVSQALLHSNIGGDAATDGGLRKTGAGTLLLTGFSNFTGETNIDAGTLAIGAGGSLYDGGTLAGNLKVNNGGTLRFDRTDTFGNAANENAFTLTVNAGGNVLSNGQFNSIHNVVLNGGTLTANGGLFIEGPGSIGAYGLNGTVTANGAVTSTIANGGGNDNFIRIGREGTSEATVFDVTNAAGVLEVNVELRNNFGATSGLTKTGAGTMILDATASHTGATTVSAGTLVINGNISTSTTTVQSGATLGGSGTVGSLIVLEGGTVAPGNSPGILNTGDYDQAGTLSLELDGTTAGTGGHDQINVTGNVTLSGLLTATVGYTPVNGDLLFILANDGEDAINGTFSGIAHLSTITLDGTDWQISYQADSTGETFTGGNDIALMAVPEPGAALIGGLGMLLLLRRRR